MINDSDHPIGLTVSILGNASAKWKVGREMDERNGVSLRREELLRKIISTVVICN